MTKKNILKKKQQLKNQFNFDYTWKEEIIEEIIDETDDEKEQEEIFYNLVDILEQVKKKDIKSFVRENKNEINALPNDLKNNLLNLIKDKI